MKERIFVAALVASLLAAQNAWRSRPILVMESNPALSRSLQYLDVHNHSPQIIQASEYLSSFSWKNPLTLRGFLVELALHRFRGNPIFQFLSLILLGAIPFLNRFPLKANSPNEFFEKYIDRFVGLYSIGIFASIADLFHHVMRVRSTEFALENQKAGSLENPYSLLRLEEEHTQEVAQNRYEFKYHFPDPLLPNVFPKLCIGWGGLEPMQSLQVSQRNFKLAEILNRLSFNLLVDCGLYPETDRFQLEVSPGVCVESVHEFIARIPGLSLQFCRNSSSFGFMLCVQDGKQTYRQIPLAYPGRTQLRDPTTGNQLSILSYHSCLVLIGDKTCPLGEFRTDFYLGPEGFTGWKPDSEYIKPWARLEHEEALGVDHVREAVRCCTCLSAVVNLASKTQGFARGGYALHGTCLDTVAILKQVVLGRVTDFPLVASGDAKAGCIASCVAISAGLKKSKKADLWAEATLQSIQKAMWILPDDTSIPPEAIFKALDRFESSLLGDFAFNLRVKEEIVCIRERWKTIL